MQPIVYGQIYWAKLKGYSSWPCMVSYFDENSDFWRTGSRGTIEYFVEFFGVKVEYAWVTQQKLKIYTAQETCKGPKGLKTATQEANSVLNKDISVKLNYFREKNLRNEEVKAKLAKQNTPGKKLRKSLTPAPRHKFHMTSKRALIKFNKDKYLEKFNILKSYVPIKRLSSTEMQTIIKSIKAKTSNIVTSSSLTLPRNITDLVRANSTQSFSNVDDIATPIVSQLLLDSAFTKLNSNSSSLIPKSASTNDNSSASSTIKLTYSETSGFFNSEFSLFNQVSPLNTSNEILIESIDPDSNSFTNLHNKVLLKPQLPLQDEYMDIQLRDLKTSSFTNLCEKF